MRISVGQFWFILVFFASNSVLNAQTYSEGFPLLEEYQRRLQLQINDDSLIHLNEIHPKGNLSIRNNNLKDDVIELTVPIRFFSNYNSLRPYWYSPMSMIPTKGAQIFLSTGIIISNKFFQFAFQPEFVVAQNKGYKGFNGFQEQGLTERFFTYWLRADTPELYGKGNYSNLNFGQSKLVGKFGAFELGVSTSNIWWGPGQWNALTFSNNAPGFFHGVFGSHRPAKTFFGSFELQLISGFPISEKYMAVQNTDLNNQYQNPYPKRDRYLNALMFSIQPKWIKGFHLGATRTVQTFSDSVNVNRFIDVLPVFWGITKESVGSDLIGESDRGRDQQITVFFRQVIPKAGLEFYGEFGRRDHALNMRDLVLSPAHSRAYLIGLNKIFRMPDEKLIQIRSEITQQAQSVNWVVRAKSTTPWGTNGTIGGFTNLDQAMGPGIGLGANIQILEISMIEDLNKMGLYFEKRVPFADFYDTSDLQKSGYQPWVDFTGGPLFDHQWKNLIFSGRILFTYSSNYYWSQNLGPQSDFPVKQNKFSTSTQLNLIYLFNNAK